MGYLMAYASVDDGFWDHPKVLLLLGYEEAHAALALWTLALSWSHDNTRRNGFEQAGVVPQIQVDRLLGAAGSAAAQALVRCGLWDENRRGGFEIHDFDYWQGVDRWRAMSEGGRMGAAIRHGRAAGQRAAARGANGGPQGGPQGGPLGRPQGGPLATYKQENNQQGDPTDLLMEDPTDLPSTRGSLALPDRPEVDRLCVLLADRIEQNGSKRPAITKAWRDACRLLIDKDGRSAVQIEAAVEWCQRDEFWRTNILSMPTLRRQYDRLRLAAQRQPGSRPSRDERVAAAVRNANGAQS